LFFLIPVLDSIPYWIDIRVITTGFKAEKTLTKDTVPVDVDPGEKITEGLDGLRDRLKEYAQMGARFAKWRAVIPSSRPYSLPWFSPSRPYPWQCRRYCR
jgi:fructose-bisphosphate aldolase class 1